MNHIYPRRSRHKTLEQYQEQRVPGGDWICTQIDNRFEHAGVRIAQGNESLYNFSAKDGEGYLAEGIWIPIEVDSNGEKKKLERRCVTALLKKLIRELRAENAELRQEIETMRIMAQRRELPEQPIADVLHDVR